MSEEELQEQVASSLSDDALMTELRNRELIDETNDRLQGGCKIVTVGENWFDYNDPQSWMISIGDIAHSLANLCRYTGHTHNFYSVAQHSVLVSKVVPQKRALAGLLHDATEAYIGDVAAPFKSLLPKYRAYEKKIMEVIADKYSFEYPFHDSIKKADHKVYGWERSDIDIAWSSQLDNLNYESAPETIQPLPPQEAYRIFIERFAEVI